MKKLNMLFKDIQEKLKDNTSFFYYLFLIFCVVGFLFFTNSGTLLNEKTELRSTQLNEIQTSNTLSAKILSRKYNSLSKTVEFIVWSDDQVNFDNKELTFELREQNKPSEIIETRFKQIDKNYYIIFAEVPKNWSVLSLSLGYKNIGEFDENNKSELSSIIRIYSNIDDIKSNSLMSEKSSEKYFDEIINLEIKYLNEKIALIDKENKTENEKINDAEIKITELESDKKFQTESEQNQTDSNISKLKNIKSTSENLLKENERLKKEYKNKIKIFSDKVYKK
ncbi:MAG: hypothetical protein ACRCXT_15405 [Paraclostridium sp.]